MSGYNYLPSARKISEIRCHYEDADFAESKPALYQLLCSARDAADVWRKGATLMLFADDGKLKATIHDPGTGQVWFATLSSSKGILEQVETLLQKGAGDWRQKRGK